MATQTSVIQPSGILQRDQIKTMKKDIQRLREADVQRESQRIIGAKTSFPTFQAPKIFEKPVEPPEVPEPTPPATPPAPPTPTPPPLPMPSMPPQEKSTEPAYDDGEKSFYEAMSQGPKKITHEKSAVAPEAKENATEEEKQQMFLLQSQKKDLEKQLQAIGSTKEVSVNAEKSALASEQKKLQEKLAGLIKEEGIIEAEEKNIADQEAQVAIPAERQALEKKRWELESQRQKIEKKRWAIENELVKLENNVKKLDEGFVIFNSRQSEIKNKINEINHALQQMHNHIAKGNPGKKTPFPNHEGKIHSHPIKKSAEEPGLHRREKTYLKDIPKEAKEKLAESTVVEETQRRKFMEDVEQWAASHPNHE